jgi:hypothetical protein
MAAEHSPGADRPKGLQVFDHEVDELVAGRHG